MKKIKTKLITLFFLTISGSSIYADSADVLNEPVGAYAYGGLSAVGGAFNVGYLFNPSVGLEVGGGAVGYGVGSASIAHADVVGNVPVGTKTQLIGKVGFAMANSQFAFDPNNDKKLYPAVDFGLGVNYFFTRSLSGGIQVDTAVYQQYNASVLANQNQVAVIPTIGLGYYF